MNRNLFKVIFNKRLGKMDVVSEITSAQGKSASDSSTGGTGLSRFLINPISFLLMLTMGTATIIGTANAQVVADPNAPKTQQPTILPTASGATQINIQTPSAAGVSVNQYQQFDTQSNGTILNNSRTNVNTQTAGWVQGNPWLATGSARIIVNQVNSANPSYLNGSLEVAGNRAEVIIANPAGINVNGASFINASRTTLTTGNPIINGGSLEGYRVTQGLVSVDGNGLDTSDSDYTDIIARGVKLNAGVWANNLKVTTGSNLVDATNNNANAIAGTSPASSYALDSSALGGMYANKIVFVGTEAGLGVNNAGQIAASAGNVQIDANGMLTNSGTISSNGANNSVALSATAVKNSGTISSQGNNHIATTGATQNSGTIAAGRELKLTATDIDNSNGTLNGQRVDLAADSLNNTNGKIQQTGSQALALNAGTLNNSNGGLIGYEPLDMGSGSGSTDNTGSNTNTGTGTSSTPSTAIGGGTASIVQPVPVVLADGIITVKNTLENNAGQITANGGIDLATTNGLTNHATLNLNKLNVSGGTVDNSSGTITSTQATIHTASINNTSGKFGSSGNMDLTSNSLTNSKGSITAGGALTAAVAGVVLNDDGTIASNDTLNLTAASIDNTRGTIAAIAADATLKSNGTLNNASGSITGAAIAIDSGALANDKGLIQSARSLAIDTHGSSLTNSNSGDTAGIISGGTLNLNTGELSNSAGGYIGSTDTATVNATQLTNAATIVGGKDFTITASGVDNRNGSIEVAGNTTVAVGSGTVNNAAGLIRSGNTTTLTAANVINTHTNGTDQGIEGSTVALNANNVDNTAGAIRADVDLGITGTGTVNNTSGLITSTGNVTIKDANAANPSAKTSTIINTNGTIVAGLANTIDVKSLTGDGKVLANQDLSIAVTDDFTNQATLKAANNLTLTSAGTVTNNSQIIAGNANSINAQNISNNAGAEISGTSTTVKASGSVTNRGLIDGGDTVVTGTTVNNLGTGRIYGDHLSIGATTLNNVDETVSGINKAATIAARERLDIGAATINNREHATLFSGGDMAIGGALDADHYATGKAAVLNNESATVESLGNMHLTVNQINNINTHFATAVQVVGSERVGEVLGVASVIAPSWLGVGAATNVSQLYTVDSEQLINMPNLNNELPGTYMINAENNVYIAPERSNYLVAPEGAYDSWELRDFTRTTSESVVTGTDPAKIIAGGDMTLDIGNLLNDNSQVIAGGTLSGNVAGITNKETLGTRTVQDDGTRLSNWRNQRKGRDEPATELNGYHVTHPTQTINMSTAVVLQNTAPTGSGTSIGGLNNATNIGAANGAGLANATVFATDTTDPTLIKTGAVNTNMPNSSLFSVNPNSNGYFIQTDPKFASYKNWLSSDWMLSALNLDPANMHKRLGDGFYEQKLITEQIAQLTGRRYVEGQTNDDDQYKALMQSGVTFAGQYNLRPGIALTAEQMARLTSDIVWLVEQEVTLPDGTKTTALVPKVYVAVKPGDIDGSGSLISANSINLNLTGDLNNAGTVSGRTVTQITAENINNMGGRLNANQLNLSARNDLNNIGGMIDANTSAVLSAGRDVNSVTTTATAANNYGSKTIIDRVAGIYVGTGANEILDPTGMDSTSNVNTLNISAGHNVNLAGADIANDGIGATQIKADNDLNLATVTTANNEGFYRNKRNGYAISETQDIGSNLSGTGDVKLQAGHDLNATAATVNSQAGALIAVAGHDVNIGAGTDTRSTVADGYVKQKGLLKTKTTTVHTESDESNAVGSDFTGAQVIVNAGHDANITGSNVVSDDLTSITAKNNVNIVASANESRTNQFEKHTTSGLMGTGGIGFTVGSKMQSTDTDTVTRTQNGSTVGSLYGNTNIKAGEHYTQTASTVNSPVGDVNISAKTVDINAGYNTQVTDSKSVQKQSGLTVALSTPITDALMAAKAVYDGSKDIGKSKNDRVNAMAVANTAWGTYKAAEGLGKAASNLASGSGNNGGAGNISVSITYGQSKAEQTSHDAAAISVGSTVNAGGKVNITATGAGTDSNINIIGSDVYGGTGAALNADNAVNIIAAQDVTSNDSKNKSYSANAGIAIAFGDGVSFGVTAGASYGKGKSNTDTVTQHNSHVGSGGLTTIESGGTTTLAGGQVTGKRVEVDAKDLVITSLQDTSKAHSDQFDASLQVTVGYGFSASGSLAMSKSNADYASVGEQSGIIAGDGGYRVNVKNATNITGGIVTSSQQAEDAGLNSFTTGTLTTADVANHADYSASGFSIGGGFGVNGTGEKGKHQTAQGSSVSTTNAAGVTTTTYPEGKAGAKANKSMGFGSDSDHDSSVTQAGINTRNITITDAAGQAATGKSVEQIKADVATNVVSDTVADNSGHIDNNYDAQAVQDEINLQVRVSQKFDQNRQEAKAEINAKSQALRDQAKTETDPDKKADLERRADEWQRGGVLLDMVAGGLSGPSSTGAVGIAARTLAPAVSFEIGQYFKENARLNAIDGGSRSEEGSVSHIIAHTILGAATAALSGGDALSGGLAAGGGEALAPAVTRYLYGADVKPSDLTAEQKSTVSAIIGLGGIATGFAAGGTAVDAVSSGQLAQNAVENNFLYPPEISAMVTEMGICDSIPVDSSRSVCHKKVEAKYSVLSDEHNAEMLAACKKNPDGNMCTSQRDVAKRYLATPEIQRLKYGRSTQKVLDIITQAARIKSFNDAKLSLSNSDRAAIARSEYLLGQCKAKPDSCTLTIDGSFISDFKATSNEYAKTIIAQNINEMQSIKDSKPWIQRHEDELASQDRYEGAAANRRNGVTDVVEGSQSAAANNCGPNAECAAGLLPVPMPNPYVDAAISIAANLLLPELALTKLKSLVRGGETLAEAANATRLVKAADGSWVSTPVFTTAERKVILEGADNVALYPKLKADLKAIDKPAYKLESSTDGALRYTFGDESRVGLGATINSDGVLTFQVKANPASVRKYGTGSDMFADMMNNVGQKTEIKTIVGQWSDSAGLTDNYMEYLRNLKAGMSPKTAAANTWTGRQAAKYGYTEVTPIQSNQGVRFNFTKKVK